MQYQGSFTQNAFPFHCAALPLFFNVNTRQMYVFDRHAGVSRMTQHFSPLVLNSKNSFCVNLSQMHTCKMLNCYLVLHFLINYEHYGKRPEKAYTTCIQCADAPALLSIRNIYIYTFYDERNNSKQNVCGNIYIQQCLFNSALIGFCGRCIKFICVSVSVMVGCNV